MWVGNRQGQEGVSKVNTPDRWILVEQGDIHKVFATWTGGYLDGDSWRLNSGIDGVPEIDGDYILFKGYSGSVYKCHKEAYGTTGFGGFVLADLIEKVGLKPLKGYEEYMEEVSLGL